MPFDFSSKVKERASSDFVQLIEKATEELKSVNFLEEWKRVKMSLIFLGD